MNKESGDKMWKQIGKVLYVHVDGNDLSTGVLFLAGIFLCLPTVSPNAMTWLVDRLKGRGEFMPRMKAKYIDARLMRIGTGIVVT